MPETFRPHSWGLLLAAAVAAGVGYGTLVDSEADNVQSAAQSDCAGKQTRQNRPPADDWGWKIFDGFSETPARSS